MARFNWKLGVKQASNQTRQYVSALHKRSAALTKNHWWLKGEQGANETRSRVNGHGLSHGGLTQPNSKLPHPRRTDSLPPSSSQWVRSTKTRRIQPKCIYC